MKEEWEGENFIKKFEEFRQTVDPSPASQNNVGSPPFNYQDNLLSSVGLMDLHERFREQEPFDESVLYDTSDDYDLSSEDVVDPSSSGAADEYSSDGHETYDPGNDAYCAEIYGGRNGVNESADHGDFDLVGGQLANPFLSTPIQQEEFIPDHEIDAPDMETYVASLPKDIVIALQDDDDYAAIQQDGNLIVEQDDDLMFLQDDRQQDDDLQASQRDDCIPSHQDDDRVSQRDDYAAFLQHDSVTVQKDVTGFQTNEENETEPPHTPPPSPVISRRHGPNVAEIENTLETMGSDAQGNILESPTLASARSRLLMDIQKGKSLRKVNTSNHNLSPPSHNGKGGTSDQNMQSSLVGALASRRAKMLAVEDEDDVENADWDIS